MAAAAESAAVDLDVRPPALTGTLWAMRFPLFPSLLQRRDVTHVVTRSVQLPRRTGNRIVLVSDIHARDDWFPREHVASIVARINQIEDIDLVALVGDFVGDDVSAIDWAAEELGRIEAPIAATLGNHDHWTDARYVSNALERAGIEVLTNRLIRISGGTAVAGLDSCWGGNPDPEAAFADADPVEPVIVLGHEPWLGTLHSQFLHLAGHTHHGQVRPPFVARWVSPRYMPRFSMPWPAGLYRLPEGRFVYTSAGIGYSTVDTRVLCPPEIVVLDT